jgi:signal transduction histidine kinase
MSLFAIEQLFIAILALALALIILKYTQNFTHRIWALFNFSVFGWSFFVFLVGITHSESHALLFWKCSFIFVPFIGSFFYQFVLSYCSLKRPLVVKLVYLHSLVFACLSIFTSFIFSKIFLLCNSILYARATLGYSIFFLSWCGIVTMSFVEFYIFLRKTSGLQRVQANFMFWSMLAGFTGGVSTALPCYGLNAYPFLQFSIIFYILFTSYAIFKHGVIPLDEVIKKSIFYSSLGTTVTIIYFVGFFLIGKSFDKIVGYNNLTGSILLLILIGVIFIPLRNKIQSMVDKLVLKSSPIEIATQNDNLRIEVAKTEKLKTIANLASMLVHEIKNPLANLIIYTEDLKTKKDEPEFIEKYQNLVINEIDRINSLLKEVLDYAKPSEPQLKKINPNKTIDQILLLIQSKCEKSNIKINFNSKTDHYILGDTNLMFQALLNLVLNAIDAMPQGGNLTVTTDCDSEYLVNLSKSKRFKKVLYCISVSDTGCGIDQKDLSSIFVPFFTKKKTGTGLGLPITQGIIERHGGSIEVNSVLNEGTTFQILLGKFE